MLFGHWNVGPVILQAARPREEKKQWEKSELQWCG